MPFCVDTDIPYGNAGGVHFVEMPDKIELRFAANPHGGPETLWFCLRVKHTTPGDQRPIRLILQHIGNMLGGIHDPLAMRPVFRHENGDWERLPAGTLIELPDGRHEVAWMLDAPSSHVDVAYCYPYGLPDIHQLLVDTNDYWHADTIGLSQNGRPLVRLSNSYGRDRAGLYIVARQHAGETPASWVLDGFLRHIATLGEDAPLVWCVPLTNIDGIEQGDYGKDNFPYDLNRAWGSYPDGAPMRHETLVLQRDVRRWRTRCQPALWLDFHAPGATNTSGLYTYVPNPETRPEAHTATIDWAMAIADALGPEYAAADFARVARLPSRWRTPNAGQFFWKRLRLPGLALEIPYALVGETVLTRQRYREAGERIAAGVTKKLQER